MWDTYVSMNENGFRTSKANFVVLLTTASGQENGDPEASEVKTAATRLRMRGVSILAYGMGLGGSPAPPPSLPQDS